MIGWVAGLLAPHALRVAGWLAILGALAGALLGARQVGQNAERVERMRKTIEVQREQLNAAARHPRDRDELLGRVRDGSF